MDHWKPDICVYHGGCDDGFGAAWAVWKKWPDVEFTQGHYGKPFHNRAAWAGRNVLFVDFSAPKDVLLSFLSEVPTDLPPASSIVVIDHHKTAQAGLDGLPVFDGSQVGLGNSLRMSSENNAPAIAVWFDMGQSGATMAWQFAHQTNRQIDPCPNLLTYIEDRDLWRFAFGDDTRQLSAALRTHPMDFDLWSRFAERPADLIDEGKTVLRAHQANISKFVQESFMERIGGHDVPCCNVPYHYASDVAHELLQLHPKAPFAASWFKRGDGMFQASLRSEDHRIDVSEVAKKYGGGGHRNAAGFQVPSMKDTRPTTGEK